MVAKLTSSIRVDTTYTVQVVQGFVRNKRITLLCQYYVFIIHILKTWGAKTFEFIISLTLFRYTLYNNVSDENCTSTAFYISIYKNKFIFI